MNTKVLTGGALALAVVLLLAVNIFSSTAFRSQRVDLTENRLYTLSQGTRNVLASLDEPVTLRLFLSQDAATRLPGINAYTIRVRELVDEYGRYGGDNLNIQIIDPEPFSEAEDRAVGYGLQGIPLGDGETVFYFGMVATGPTDQEAMIPFISLEREEFIEHDLTKLIYQVANPEQPVVGLISTLPMHGMNPQVAMGQAMPRPWVVLEQMRQTFEVRDLGTDSETIPEEVDVLMLVHPKGLSERTLYAIDQFVLGGGRALVFVDPLAEAEQASVPGMPGGPSELEPLLAAWGLEMPVGTVVGDLQLAERVRFTQQGRQVTVEYPVWFSVPQELINADDIVTAKLGTVFMATPGRLIVKDDAETQVLPLLQTSKAAAEISSAQIGPMSDPEQLLRDYKPAGESFVLAARVTGSIKTAFPEGRPEKAETDEEAEGAEPAEENASQAEADDAAHLAESKDDANLIVIADSDLLQDRFWVQVQNLLGATIAIPSAANGTLVINGLDNLTGSNDLISVRNRGHFARPFTRVDAIRQQAELSFREKEQALLTQLEVTEQRLLDLERGKETDNALVLSAAQQAEVERFRNEKVKIRKELRDVRHELRKDIEGLESWTKFVNVVLVPVLIAVGGVLLALHRVRRRRVAAAQATV